MKWDISKFINRDRLCQVNKAVYQKSCVYMESTTSQYPWEILAMNFFIFLPESEDGNLSIFVLTDCFSKLSLFFMLGRATGKTLTAALKGRFPVC